MLISFSFKNWTSFKNKVTISAVASKQSTHGERLPSVDRYKMRILPVLAIYGGNASGKSNIFEALDFVKELVVEGTKIGKRIPVLPFLLCSKSRKQPSKFWVEFLIDENVYEYSFSVLKSRICSEKLIKIRATTEQVLYERFSDRIEVYTKENKSQLDYIAKGTRDNQLFLTNTIEQNNDAYRDVYDWFEFGLKLISPVSKYVNIGDLIDEKKWQKDEVDLLLRKLDTGIVRLGAKESMKTIPKEIEDKDEILDLMEYLNNERYIYSLEDGKDRIRQLVAYHECEDGKEYEFNLKLESDGTKRLIELLPAFIGGKKDLQATYMIDEFDRSLHHLLLRRLLEHFLSTCGSETRRQIIITTHDLLLMDQEILRRDEIYVVERNNEGVSAVIPLNEYKEIRSDKDIRKSYLQGRFGGIPKI